MTTAAKAVRVTRHAHETKVGTYPAKLPLLLLRHPLRLSWGKLNQVLFGVGFLRIQHHIRTRPLALLDKPRSGSLKEHSNESGPEEFHDGR
jgi:hypothetical protein